MKKIGLVGGTGPESTLMYYKELNTRIDQLTYREAMPDLAIESVDFRRAWAYVSAGEKNSPLPVLDSVEIHIRKIIDLAL